MFVQWRREFQAMGFTTDELHSATDYISREARGVTRWDHLQAIRDYIRRQRRVNIAKPRENADTFGTCDLCGNTGWAGGLPHLSQLDPSSGEWLPLVDGRPVITMAAVCTCICGRWQLDAWEERDADYKKKYRKPMTLVEYTTRNSQWKAQVRELAERRRSASESDVATRMADESGGTLRGALAGVLRKLRPSDN